MRAAEVVVLGQGLAGTVLGWALERAGIEFALVDPGHTGAASLAAAGIVNPVTGRRLVKTWRAETLIPAAREYYREIEAAWRISLWRDVRIRRLFANDRERQTHAAKMKAGALAPFGGEADDEGFWIHGAGRVDLARLLRVARERWVRHGRLIPGLWQGDATSDAAVKTAVAAASLVIDARGLATAQDPHFGFVPWEYSKGDVLVVAVEGLVPDVIVNRGEWVLPIEEGRAWVGATHEPRVTKAEPSPAARARLEARLPALGIRTFTVCGHFAGVRVNLPDKRPVVGRHPHHPRLGVLNGLGAKGVMLAPFLAHQWVNHFTCGTPFDREIDLGRFSPDT